MKQTRQSVRAVKQSIYLDVYAPDPYVNKAEKPTLIVTTLPPGTYTIKLLSDVNKLEWLPLCSSLAGKAGSLPLEKSFVRGLTLIGSSSSLSCKY
jgi:hypothetical protein